MKTIKRSIDINASQQAVFDLTQDYERRVAWDPYLIEATLLHGATEAGVGVESRCKNKSGQVMVSRYIVFNRPVVAAVTMREGPWMLKRFSGAWNVKSLPSHSNQRVRLVFTYNFVLRGQWLGRLLTPIASYLFSLDMEKRLIAIKHYVEAGH